MGRPQHQPHHHHRNTHVIDEDGVSTFDVLDRVASLRRKADRRARRAADRYAHNNNNSGTAAVAVPGKDFIEQSQSRLEELRRIAQRFSDDRVHQRRRFGGGGGGDGLLSPTALRGGIHHHGGGSAALSPRIAAGTTPSRRLSGLHAAVQHDTSSATVGNSVARVAACMHPSPRGGLSVAEKCEGSVSRLAQLRNIAAQTCRADDYVAGSSASRRRQHHHLVEQF